MGGGEGKIYDVEEFENTDGWGVQHGQVLTNFAAHILDARRCWRRAAMA